VKRQHQKLKYEGFEEYFESSYEVNNGYQFIFKFPNNYGASVISHDGSYTSQIEPFELAMTYKDSLCVMTDSINGVMTHLANDDVLELLDSIKKIKVCDFDEED
jgi:hypothetical protein